MKEKILAQLKLKRANSSSPSDRTLETLATILSATVTDEAAIEAAVEPYSALLTEFSGETSHLIAEAVKKLKTESPKKPDDAKPKPGVDNGEPAWFTEFKAEQLRIAEEQKAKQEEIENKLSAFDKQKATDAMIASAKNAFYKKYKISESEKPLCDKALAVELKMNQHDSPEKLIAGWKTQYEDFRAASGLGGIDPVDANDGGKNKGTPILNELKSQLQKSGKLPAPAQT